jgi:hypothetical protein
VSFLNLIIPPENATPAALVRWRYCIAGGLLVALIGLGYAFSPAGFAWASDVDRKIAEAIDTKIKPIADEQREQRAVLNRVSQLLTEQLAASVASQIRLNISKRCKSTSAQEREELAREKDRLQQQYREYKGERYPEPTCSEL